MGKLNWRPAVVASGVALVVLAGTTEKAAAELVRNGGFENGFGGWTVNVGADPTNAPIIIQYNSTSGVHEGAFGESIPAPVNGGTSAAYFYSDAAAQSISQNVSLIAGTEYTESFDIYAPQNGRNNPFDSVLFASLNGTAVSTKFSAYALNDGWMYYSTNFTASQTGPYDLALNFQGGGIRGPAADFVLDNVSLSAAIPELSTWAMMILGFCGLSLLAYRRRNHALVNAA